MNEQLTHKYWIKQASKIMIYVGQGIVAVLLIKTME